MSTQICTFYVDGIFFGLRVMEVQEVVRYQEMTPIPLAPSVIAGLINLRGQIVTAIDLRVRLELPPVDLREARPMNIVVSTEGGAVSLLVDEIGDVIEVDEDAFELPPDTLQGQVRALISRVYKLPERLLLLLDTYQTMDFAPTRAA